MSQYNAACTVSKILISVAASVPLHKNVLFFFGAMASQLKCCDVIHIFIIMSFIRWVIFTWL